jgi:hypothetical protein
MNRAAYVAAGFTTVRGGPYKKGDRVRVRKKPYYDDPVELMPADESDGLPECPRALGRRATVLNGRPRVNYGDRFLAWPMILVRFDENRGVYLVIPSLLERLSLLELIAEAAAEPGEVAT